MTEIVPQETLPDTVSRPPTSTLAVAKWSAYGVVTLSLVLLGWQYSLWAAALGGLALLGLIVGLLTSEAMDEANTLTLLDNVLPEEEDRTIR